MSAGTDPPVFGDQRMIAGTDPPAFGDQRMRGWQIEQLAGRELRRITANIGLGLHVLLALDPVGTGELIALLDGSTAPRRGRALLDGRCPYRDPEVRQHIGSSWAVEALPRAASVSDSLGLLELDRGTVERAKTLLEQLGQTRLLKQTPDELTNNQTRLVALSVALSKPELWSLLLFEPLLVDSPKAAAGILELVTQQATRIPVLVVTSSQILARQLGGATAELGGGFWRSCARAGVDFSTVRVAGASLRALAAEIVRRPRVRSLRMTAHAAGHDELWIETNDPSGVSLDIVREARQLGVKLWLLDANAGAR